LYTDNSTSAWLGDERGGWKGLIYGDLFRNLCVIKDVSCMKVELWLSLMYHRISSTSESIFGRIWEQ
jgi:hypothetical protein